MADGGEPGLEEVGSERYDQVGSSEVVLRDAVAPEHGPVGRPQRFVGEGLVPQPAGSAQGLGPAVHERIQGAGQGRRDDGDPVALPGPPQVGETVGEGLLRPFPADRIEHAPPGGGVRDAPAARAAVAVRAVQPLKRGLASYAEGAAVGRMRRIALDLDRSPSRVLTRVPQPLGHSPQTLAYQVATPGTTSSGGTTYGMIRSGGAGAQAVTAAADPAPPSTRRNVRRPTVVVSPSGPLGWEDDSFTDSLSARPLAPGGPRWARREPAPARDSCIARSVAQTPSSGKRRSPGTPPAPRGSRRTIPWRATRPGGRSPSRPRRRGTSRSRLRPGCEPCG